MSYNVRLQNFEKNDNINNNIYSRNLASNNIQMHFSPRPVLSKYAIMPILDNKKQSSVLLDNYKVYNQEEIFFPSNRKPHYCGFASSVDKESTLRNQFFALQKSEQSVYVPSSNSDLYENHINFINNHTNIDEQLLFKQEKFDEFNPNVSENIGNRLFHNNTRVQLKNIK